MFDHTFYTPLTEDIAVRLYLLLRIKHRCAWSTGAIILLIIRYHFSELL